MPSSAFTKFQCFTEDVGRAKHNLNTDVLKVYLTNAAPNVATNKVKADLAEIAAGNGYPALGITPTNSGYVGTAGVGKLTLADGTITAAGGSVGPARYAVLYNSTATGSPLIGYWDYGAAFTLGDGESIAVDLDQAAGVLTIA